MTDAAGLQRLIVATVHDAVVVLQPDGRVLDWNAAATRIFDFTRDEIVGRSATVLAMPGARRALRQAIARGQRWSGDVRCRRKGGQERTCEVVLAPLLDPAGALQAIVAVCRDVTGRRRMAARLAQAQKLEAIGQLAAGIAHEINTPTQYVADNVRFAARSVAQLFSVVESQRVVAEACRAAGLYAGAVGALDAAAAAADLEFLEAELPLALGQALEGIERIAEIVRGMKAFSHPGAGTLTPTDLNHQLESALAVSRNAWRDAADVVWDLDGALPLVFCRVGDINQVLLNIVVNALHAIAEAPARPDGGRGEIRVSSRGDGAWVEIRIGDTGGGIPEDVRPRIFDPFFTTREVGRGTGQGLAIAHAIVETHGGTIEFETALGVGTTFVVRLPIAGVPDVPDVAAESAA